MGTTDEFCRLCTVSPSIGAAFLQVYADFARAYPSSRLGITQGYRSPALQKAASSAGASPFDGSTSFSKHQHFPSMALDFAVFSPDDTYVTDGTDARYSWVGAHFETAGLVWGGRWTHPDFDHVELSGPSPDRDSVAEGYSAWLRTAHDMPSFRV
jgi:hypothetical protein